MRNPPFLDGWTITSGFIDQISLDELVGTPVWSDGTGLSIGTSTDPKHSYYTLRFADQLVARVCVETRRIELYRLSPDIPQETVEHFLFDQIIPRVVSHSGSLVLHAGAVAAGSEVLAFLGPSGFGKSTLVASFHEAGAALLGDDAQVVSNSGDRISCRALNSGLRLFPDSIAEIFREQPDLAAFTHYSPKQRVVLPPSDEAGGPDLPLAAMFFLGAEPPDRAISLRPMAARESCMGIITNSFSLDPTDAPHQRDKLKQASAMAARVPAFELSFPRDYACLPELRSAIADQLRSRADLAPKGSL